ncbi:protein saal1 isoform X4 [Narcine bancroftii]|uniref:protein saal1 isoform X4 n=1 Tax=Narcine bancroftii TaxID=1343680 RepID=UPI0038315047
MDRNPSPPPNDESDSETTGDDAIGSTVYSKHWLFSTLMQLIKFVSTEGEETEVLKTETQLDEDLENEICKVWDMSMDEDVTLFLEEFNVTDILLGIIGKSKCPRLTEICVGILGNMACYKETCQSITNNDNLVEVLLLLLGDSDPPTLLETSRLILTCLSQPDVATIWVDQIHKQPAVRDNVCFIMQSSTNTDLLGKIGEMIDKLFDLDKELMLSWIGESNEPSATVTEQEKTAEILLVPCLLEAARQVRSDSVGGLEVYVHILQLLTTIDEGIQAIDLPLLGTLLRVLFYAEECPKKPPEGTRRPSADKWSVPSPVGAQKGKRQEGGFHMKILLNICCEFLSEIFMDISKELVMKSFEEGYLNQKMCICAVHHLLPLYTTAVERLHDILKEVQPDTAEQLQLKSHSLQS